MVLGRHRIIMIEWLVLLTFGAVLSAPTDDRAPFFRNDYTLIAEQNAFYKLHRSRVNFSDAVATCSAEGAELFLPKSKSESEAVFGFMKKPDINIIWLAIHDLFGEGIFINLQGESLDDMYYNWGPGEPNNVANNENCVIMNKDTTFNDVPCSDKFSFVCRRAASNLTSNILCETYDLAYNYNTELDACYKIHTTPMKWREAFRICRSEMAHLAIINSVAEAQMLVREWAKYPDKKLPGNFDKGNLLLGFNDLINPGVYLTVEGKPLSETGYEKWGGTQPDNFEGKEHCGAMFRDGDLNDLPCDNRALFVCEKPLSRQSVPNFNSQGSVVSLPDA